MKIAHLRTDNSLQTGPYVALYRRWQDYEFNAFTASTDIPSYVRSLHPSASAWLEAQYGRRFEMAKIVQNHDVHDPWLDS